MVARWWVLKGRYFIDNDCNTVYVIEVRIVLVEVS